jgi:hypothetical protein
MGEGRFAFGQRNSADGAMRETGRRGEEGGAFNFVSFRPKKSTVTLEIKLPQTDDINSKIEQAGLDALEYNAHWGVYRLRLTSVDVKGKADVLRELMRLAYERRTA